MNEYSNRFIGKCIFKFMNKLLVKKQIMFIVSKKQPYIVLPFMGKILVLVKTGLAKSPLNNIIITIIDIINVQVSSLYFYLKKGLFTSNFEDF